MTEESKKKTRKRNTEEQALWDQIEVLKLAKRKADQLLKAYLIDLQKMDDPDNDALASAASGIRYALREITELSSKIDDTEAQYKALRG